MAIIIKRLISRTPRRDLILLIGICVLMIGVFIFQQMTVARQDFYVAHHFLNTWPTLRILAIALGVLYVGFWGILKNTKITSRTIIILTGIAFVIIAITILKTHPTRSQDLYHGLLLGKGFVEYGFNPYMTIPADIQHAWGYPVIAWRDIPMIYGPIWAFIVIGISLITTSLGTALVIAKLFFILVVVSLGYLLFRSAEPSGFSREDSTKITALLLLNPFLIQAVLVDGHSDILVGFFLLASFYFLSREKYGLSIVALAGGGLVKYAPFLIVLVPIFLAIKKYHARKLKELFIGIGVSLFLVVAMYKFFSATIEETIKLISSVNLLGLPTEYLPGTTVLLQNLHMGANDVRLFGIISAIGVLIWALHKKNIPLAYTMPFIFFFFFATPWFQPWYVLWVLPVLFIAWPSVGVVLLTVFLLPMPELVSPSAISFIAMTTIVSVQFFHYLFRFEGREVL